MPKPTLVPLALDAKGGVIHRVPGFDLKSPRSAIQGFDLWEETPTGDNRPPFELVFRQDAEIGGCYELRVLREDLRSWPMWGTVSEDTLPLKPNRNYIISALINCDFQRPTEINLGMATRDAAGKLALVQVNGLPNQTHGWQRWEWEITTDPRAAHGLVELDVYQFGEYDTFAIADLCFIELPPASLPVYAPGEGATFRGSAGNLPMHVERVEQTPDGWIVETTGARFTFDSRSDTLEIEQRIEHARPLSRWQLSMPLAGLQIIREDASVCVLANAHLTFGIQCDSLVMVVPHEDANLRCKSAIGGKWNRLEAGHLLAMDDYGGFAVNPDLPAGTGLLARVDTGIWPGRAARGMLDFAGTFDRQDFISRAEPGWEITWRLQPGERIGISAFPPRPYPWKQSFEGGFALSEFTMDTTRYRGWREDCQAVILWDFFERSWGMSYGARWTVRDGERLREHIRAAKDAGLKPVPYMSAWFYHSRDAVELTDEVRRLRDEWGFEGVYYDGLPVEDWVAAYEEMRLTREAYPDGTIILHHTFPTPLMEAGIELPAITTYADITFMGEEICGDTQDWAYPKYMVSQYRKANTIGVMKHNKWRWSGHFQRDMMMLRYNGRADVLSYIERGLAEDPEQHNLLEIYRVLLSDLKSLWRLRGDDPNFYEKYYLPAVLARTEALLLEDSAVEMIQPVS
jgi:hypothetical protein